MQRTLSRGVWRPSPFVVASAALHLAAGVAILARPRLWPLSLSAVIADHLVLTAAGLWPRSSLLGPNLTRLPPAAAARGLTARPAETARRRARTGAMRRPVCRSARGTVRSAAAAGCLARPAAASRTPAAVTASV